jgi:hypothetical protein
MANDLTPLQDGALHPVFNWQMMSVIVLLLVAGTTGAIQLGAVSTHVQINGDRLSLLETNNKEQDASISNTGAHQIFNEQRLNTIEAHDLVTRDMEARIIERLSKIEAAMDANHQRVEAILSRLLYNEERVEKQRVDFATKGDIQQALNVTRLEFIAELKRLDQELAELKRSAPR